MNRYERFVQKLGFENPVQGKTRAPKDELVGIRFTGCDERIARKALGRSTAHKPDVFFYKRSKTQAILVDLQRNRVLLANSKRAVSALLKTVNS